MVKSAVLAIASFCAAVLVWWLVTHKHNHPKDPVTTFVWRPSHKEFVYPELDARFGLKEYLENRDDFGIAFAGGGTRGMAFAHGAARTLHNAGILQRARYATVSSGSAWFGIPMYYQTQDSIDTYLGKSLPPEQLSPEVLSGESAGSMITRLEFPILRYPMKELSKSEKRGKVQSIEELFNDGAAPPSIRDLVECFRDPCACAMRWLIPDTSLEELWQLISAYLFLRPFGLASRDAVYAQPSEVTRVKSQLGENQTIFSTRDIKRDRLPFLLSQAAVFAPGSGTNLQRNPLAAFPYENTPLYSGVSPSYAGKEAARYQGLGDVLVEPFAARSQVIQPLSDQAVSSVKVSRQRTYTNFGDLAEWAGVTTAYFADYQAQADWTNTFLRNGSFCRQAAAEKVLPSMPMWSPLLLDKKTHVPHTRTFPLGDAGIYDDLGHLPLLRRNVSKMVIFDTSALSNSSDPNSEADIREMTFMTAAFGQPNSLFNTLPGSPNPNMPRDYMTVFDSKDFDKLWAEVQRLKAERKPVIIRGKHTTVENKHFGIVGGRLVDIVWVLGMDVAAWRNALPIETEGKLPKYFPNYKCSEVTTKFQLGAVSQFSSWLTEQALQHINAMLGESVSHAADHDETVVV